MSLSRRRDGCNNITYVVDRVSTSGDVLTKKLRCTCGVKFCYVCGVSKKPERDKCNCSHPNMQHEEPIEGPVSGEEGMATNDQHEERVYDVRGHQELVPGPVERKRRSRAEYQASRRHRAERRMELAERERIQRIMLFATTRPRTR